MSYISPAEAQPLVRGPRAFISPSRYATEYTARLAHSDRFREDAYRLRHDSYSEGGFIEARADGRFEDEYDQNPDNHVVVVYANNVPVASVRVCLMSRDRQSRAPAKTIFPDEVQALLEATPGGRGKFDAVEINRLVRHPSVSNNQGLVFLLYRLAGHIVLENDVQMIMSCVRRNHIPFYKRLRFHELAGAKTYPGLNCAMHLLACPRPEYDGVRKVFSMMDPEAGAPNSLDGFLKGSEIMLPLMDNRGG